VAREVQGGENKQIGNIHVGDLQAANELRYALACEKRV